jgi:spore maturation protein CgeB
MNQNREIIFPILENQLNFKQFTTIWGWSVSKAYQEGKMGINIPVSNDPLNMRCFEIGACRIPQIIGFPDNDSNGLFELFKDEEDILTFPLSDISKLKELVVRILINPQIGEKLAENMFNKVIKQHTYKHRMNFILEAIGYTERI